ncbi:MAG: tRNA (adenosine(37)-N6)-threonylcarbamoyltransferase complex dimerization subunit type 1 TsaB [Gammaproteobacteria bacterium]
MKILAIDTATEACSAALYIDGVITTKYEIAPRQHAELILTMVDELLAESNLSLTRLDALAFGRGPGAFTGVRIATGVIQGLAMSADCPVIPVSTLAALAQGVISASKQVACAIDARMGEVYWGLYQANEDKIMQLVGEESVCPPISINIPDSGAWLGVGSGWETYEAELQDRMGNTLTGCRQGDYPSAEAICALAVDAYQRGETVDAADALPIYLRDKVTS